MKHLPTFFFLSTLLVSLAVPSSRAQDPLEQKTVIPPGKEERGLTLFVEKGCYQCHSAGATKFPEVELAQRLVIELGDDVHRPWTRDDFARAILNPNHTVAEDYRIAMMRVGDNFKAENSPMPEYVDLLTVSDLIHLTTFLDTISD